MSKHDEATYLGHMRDHAEYARQFASGRYRADLDDDRMLLFAVLRALELIGEAATHVSDGTRLGNPQIAWSSIIGLRHRLIHGYETINLDIVWGILSNDLQPLITALDAMLSPPPNP